MTLLTCASNFNHLTNSSNLDSKNLKFLPCATCHEAVKYHKLPLNNELEGSLLFSTLAKSVSAECHPCRLPTLANLFAKWNCSAAWLYDSMLFHPFFLAVLDSNIVRLTNGNLIILQKRTKGKERASHRATFWFRLILLPSRLAFHVCSPGRSGPSERRDLIPSSCFFRTHSESIKLQYFRILKFFFPLLVLVLQSYSRPGVFNDSFGSLTRNVHRANEPRAVDSSSQKKNSLWTPSNDCVCVLWKLFRLCLLFESHLGSMPELKWS